MKQSKVSLFVKNWNEQKRRHARGEWRQSIIVGNEFRPPIYRCVQRNIFRLKFRYLIGRNSLVPAVGDQTPVDTCSYQLFSVPCTWTLTFNYLCRKICLFTSEITERRCHRSVAATIAKRLRSIHCWVLPFTYDTFRRTPDPGPTPERVG